MKHTVRLVLGLGVFLILLILGAATVPLRVGEGAGPMQETAGQPTAKAEEAPTRRVTPVSTSQPDAPPGRSARASVPAPQETRQSAPSPVPTSTPTSTLAPSPTPTPPWAVLLEVGDGAIQPPTTTGKSLVVDQDHQVLRVYEEGVEVRALPASTGKPPLYTPAYAGRVRHYVGTFYSYGTWADDAWYIFFASSEILIHGAPYTVSEDGDKLYQGLEDLGVRPASHGCIRLHPDDARWLTNWNPEGVPILITPLDLNKEW